jgi:acyl-CoA thioester hydrolase
MNVQFYLAKASDAQAMLAAQLGLMPSRLRQSATGRMMPSSERILFKRELRAGDIFHIKTGVRAIAAGGTLDIASRMINQETGTESAAFETRLLWMTPDRSGPAKWPEDVVAAAAAVAGESPEALPPRRRMQPAPKVPDLDRMVLTYRGSLESWECEADGIAPPRAHIARFNDAIAQLFRVLEIDRRSLLRRGFGSAALDYDLLYQRPMWSGQSVEIHSGLLAAEEKVFHVAHYILDSSSREVITSIVVAALFFDLAARKSVSIEQALPGKAASLLGRFTRKAGGSL